MAKNPRRAAPSSSSAAPQAKLSTLVSPRGLRIILCGVGVIVLGFVFVCFTDPLGQNWASVLSPFLLIAGYTLVGFGLSLPNSSSDIPKI